MMPSFDASSNRSKNAFLLFLPAKVKKCKLSIFADCWTHDAAITAGSNRANASKQLLYTYFRNCLYSCVHRHPRGKQH
jgi:hypothetical protein